MTRLFNSSARAVCLVATTLLAACVNGGDTTAVSSGPFYTITTSVSDSVKFPVGSVVSVRSTITHDAAAVLAAPVGWTVKEGGGSVNVASATTDTLGHATVLWTLGDTAGINTLIIATTDRADTLSVITTIGDPAYVVAVGLDSSLTAVGGSTTLQARVTDKLGNNVPNVPISWTTLRGTLSAAVVPSDSKGISAVTFSATAPGNYFVTAELAGRATHIFHVLVQ